MMLLVAFLASFAIYYIEMKLFRHLWKKGLSVDILFLQKGINAGQTGVIRETVSNSKRLPLPILEVKFATAPSFLFEKERITSVTDRLYKKDLFSLRGRQRTVIYHEFKAMKRGYFSIDEIDVLTKDYFFSQEYAVRVKNDTAIYVYPMKLDTHILNPFFARMMGDVVTRRRMEEDLFAFRGIREYHPGDSMRRINWKNTAHTGNLLVNVYETTTAVEVCLLLDQRIRLPFDEEEISEELIALASSVSSCLLESGISVELYSNYTDIVTREPVTVTDGVGRGHIARIDRALARADKKVCGPALEELLREQVQIHGKKKCYLVLSSDYTTEFLELLMAYQRQKTAVYAIMPYSSRSLKKIQKTGLMEHRNMIYPWCAEVAK